MSMTESRFAIGVSLLALAVSGWQAWAAQEANSFNKEQVTIDAAASDIPNARIGPATCWGEDFVTIGLHWRVTIFNHSTQPITIKALESVGLSPGGMMSASTVTPNGPATREFPALIEARNFKTIDVALPTRASPEFATWFRQNGGCEGKPIWPSAAGREQFDETGWAPHQTSGAMFTAVTGGGQRVFVEAVWR